MNCSFRQVESLESVTPSRRRETVIKWLCFQCFLWVCFFFHFKFISQNWFLCRSLIFYIILCFCFSVAVFPRFDDAHTVRFNLIWCRKTIMVVFFVWVFWKTKTVFRWKIYNNNDYLVQPKTKKESSFQDEYWANTKYLYECVRKSLLVEHECIKLGINLQNTNKTEEKVYSDVNYAKNEI